MSNRKQGLTRGARAQFFRDGHELHSACDIPAAGAFVVRDLPPGQWVARDSCGGEQAFNVTVMSEVVTLLEGAQVGVTGGPGISGTSASDSQKVGPGGGVFTSPEQVAPGETITTAHRRDMGEVPHEKVPRPPHVAPVSQRPEDPTAEVRVPGGAGSALVQDAPIRSVDETVAEAGRRANLSPDDRELEHLEADENVEEVPLEVRPNEQGPSPLGGSTIPPAGYGASSPNTPTPLEGRREGDAQPVLGAEPEAA